MAHFQIGDFVEAKGTKGTIEKNASGWYTIATDDGEIKARQADIVLVDAVEDLEGNTRDLDPADYDENGAKTDNEWRITCSECENAWTVVQDSMPVNIHCPECGAWCVVRLDPDHERYLRGLGTTASGNDTYDVNDDVAATLRGLEISEAYNVAAERILELGSNYLSKSMRKDAKEHLADVVSLANYFASRWGARNLGMQRMNLGNVLRGVEKRAREDEEGIE